MFESVQSLLAEHDELQGQLADPDLHSDPVRSRLDGIEAGDVPVTGTVPDELLPVTPVT